MNAIINTYVAFFLTITYLPYYACAAGAPERQRVSIIVGPTKQEFEEQLKKVNRKKRLSDSRDVSNSIVLGDK
jgi:hypothetical protein